MVALGVPGTEEAGEVEWRFDEDGSRVRVSVKTGTVVPIPTRAEETADYKDRKSYKANAYKDTLPKDVTNITYEPRLATFEMDIMQADVLPDFRRRQACTVNHHHCHHHQNTELHHCRRGF